MILTLMPCKYLQPRSFAIRRVLVFIYALLQRVRAIVSGFSLHSLILNCTIVISSLLGISYLLLSPSKKFTRRFIIRTFLSESAAWTTFSTSILLVYGVKILRKWYPQILAALI